jgi:DNA-binding transcriptional MerR regulator
VRDLRTISDLAREADVPVSTLRYYEREGLLEPDSRTKANYRVYSDGAVERLHFIRTAQTAGFTIADIKQLLELRSGDTTCCKTVRPLIESRLSHVDTQIHELQQIRRTLDSFLEICKRSDEDGACGALEKLDD